MLHGLLLAAGASQRFGSNKLLHPFNASNTVIEAAATNLMAALPRSTAVVRPGSGDLSNRLSRLGLDVVIASQAKLGMGASIAAGIAATSSADGWVIALGDMPWVQPATLVLLANAIRTADQISVPLYQGIRGNPVAFGAAWRTQLLELTGDRGARRIIEEHADRVIWIPVDDSGVRRDVDSPADIVGNVET